MMAMVVSEGKRLEPVTKTDTSLSLMFRPKEIGPYPSTKEDAIKQLFTLNIQVKNGVISAIIDTNS